METVREIKKALIFDQYLDLLGGGERYSLTFAQQLAALGYDVEVAWKDGQILKEAEKRFGLNLSKITLNPQAYINCSQKISIIKKFQFTRKYETIFWVSDGSIPFLFSPKSFVHLQVPFLKLGGNRLTNSIKSFFIKKFVYNSEFTKSIHEKNLNSNKSFVLYPPVDVASLKPGFKEKIILSVARFSSVLTSKRQDLLIDAFRLFSDKISGFKLVMVGGLVGDSTIISTLKNQAQGLNVEIVANPSFENLKNLYTKSTLFWHAAGYKIDERLEPEKVEHFGMTTVEAMASGCLPVVINKGGQREVVVSGQSGYLVDTVQEMVDRSIEIVKNENLAKNLTKQAIDRSKIFAVDVFFLKVQELLA